MRNLALEKWGIGVPEILLPRGDLSKWAVVACDQYTQDGSYWAEAAAVREGSPSALDLILPEFFIKKKDCKGDHSGRLAHIHRSMRQYLEDGVFFPPRRAFVYLERSLPSGGKRRGLLALLDLERYSYRPGAGSLIRSTEGTVPERLPVRMDVRRGAALEIPHVLVLVDDREDRFLPELGRIAKKGKAAYEFPLMPDGGGVSGWFLEEEDGAAFLAGELDRLARRQALSPGEEPFLFAAGDGNHSLAAAREIWEECKRSGAGGDHPARWAMVEIENLYDPAIHFKPIHRLVFNAGIEEILSCLSELPDFSRRDIPDAGELVRLVNGASPPVRIGLVSGEARVLVETSAPGIAAASLQPLLDRLAAERGKALIDYVHGGEELLRLSGAPGAVGILLPPVEKKGLFETVARTGPLPRKSFSMGEAAEKRFYLEWRSLF
jgi:hypothetical protein